MKSTISKQPQGIFICIKSRGAYLLCLIGIVLLLMISINLIIESHSNFDTFIIRRDDISRSKIAEYFQVLEWPVSYEYRSINSTNLIESNLPEIIRNQTNVKPTIAYVFAGIHTTACTI
jgi:hypothetical protein